MKLSNSDLADDIDSLTDDSQDLQALVDNITSSGKCISLSINTKKMKNIVIGSSLTTKHPSSLTMKN